MFKDNGTVTAGNSSGINDGAAATILMSREEAESRSIQPLVKIVSWAACGVDPSLMGTGPIPASKLALKKAGWKINDLDLIESNEAFAAQAIVVNKELDLDPEIVNVNGGAIALGHPIGASGARITGKAASLLKSTNSNRAIATMCIGGGMGIAIALEKI